MRTLAAYKYVVLDNNCYNQDLSTPPKCLAKLGSDGKGDTLLFCSGGNEKLLHLWEHSPNTGASPTLRGSMGRQEEESTHHFAFFPRAISSM